MHQQQQGPAEDIDGEIGQLRQRIQALEEEKKHREQRASSGSHHNLAASYHQHPQNGVSPRAAMVRSKSNVAYSSQPQSHMMPAPDASGLQAHSRQRRAISQQSHSTPAMSRGPSNRSASGMPFKQMAASIAPIASTPPSRAHARDDLPSPLPYLPSVRENEVLPGVGINPADWLMNNPSHSYLGIPQCDLSSDEFYGNVTPSACPSIVSSSSAADGTAPTLSRQSSLFDQGMMRVVSSQSFAAPDSFAGAEMLGRNLSQASHSAPQSFDGAKMATPSQDLLGLTYPYEVPYQFPSSTNLTSMSLSPESANMERSDSTESTDSNTSTASKSEQRFKDAQERVRKASTAKIAPKPCEASANGPAKSKNQEAKVALPNGKAYQRPKHPKVHCPHCKDHPDGFRGDHELRRHIAAKHHGGYVKKFICRDPATVGLKATVPVRHPLNKCKACNSRKPYGAYYNAAAHLRRTHFKPKTTRARRGVEEEKRGGMGGGDWPAMADLKMWFEEIMVKVDADTPITDDLEQDGQDMMLDSPSEVYSGPGNGMPAFDDAAHFNISFNEVDSGAFPVDDSVGGPYFFGDASQMSVDDFVFPNPGPVSMGMSTAVTPNPYEMS